MTTQVATVGVKDSPAGSQQWVYRLRRGLARDARPLGRQGRGRGRDDAHPGPDMVPAGFTITTEACVAYMRGGRTWPDGPGRSRSSAALAALEKRAGKRLGDAEDPLLVSVRSGARDSMPGMMDTVLNLGLNDESVAGLAARTEDERFAWDCYRRLVQMFGNVVRGIPGERFEEEIARVKRERGVTLDTELDAEALRELTESFKSFYDFPTEPRAATDRGDPGRVRLVDGRAGRSVPPHQPAPGRLGDGRQRAADGVRQQGRRRRAPGWPSAVTRSPGRRRRRATSCPAPRARTSCPASARRATSPSCAIGCRRSPIG